MRVSNVRQVAIHLASGARVVAEVEGIPDDFDDDDLLQHIRDDMPPKADWGIVGNVVIHSGAVSAVELL